MISHCLSSGVARSFLQGVCLLALLFVGVRAGASDQPGGPKLAILVGSGAGDEIQVVREDVASMDKALRQRGFSRDEILTLTGDLRRKSLMLLLEQAQRRVAGWHAGTVFLYYGGHGFVDGDTVSEARVGLQLSVERGAFARV